MFNTKPTPTVIKNGPRPVWVFYAMSIFTALFAIIGSYIYWPPNPPNPDDLIMIGGDMSRLVIRDDFSNTSAGAQLPIFTSVYIRFKGVEGEFRYPWIFPKYHNVREETAVYANIWIERAALGQNTTPLIWAIKESNRYKEKDNQTIISFKDVLESQRLNGITLFKFCISMILGSISFALIGFSIGRYNRRKYPTYYLK